MESKQNNPESQNRDIVRTNFWPPYLGDGDSNLYLDEVGWRIEFQTDAQSSDTKEIYDFLVGYYGFDLVFYFLEDNQHYYANMFTREVYRLQTSKDWDGVYAYERCEIESAPLYNYEVLYDFEDADDLWSNFQLDGHNLKYIIEHSVVETSH